ncbi:MAG: hypothetical protein R2708_22190 [Vicinamibacterales bacterium]
MPRLRPTLRDERGTAVTETLMLTWIIIVFVAAALQLFRVNQSLYLSITTAHQQMFQGAWRANCFNKSSRCIYNSDNHAQVRWHPTNMPEVLVSTVGMFRQQLPGQLQIRAWSGAATPRRDGIKRTRMGAGTYTPICDCAGFGNCMRSRNTVPGMGAC